jgi:hypothetical protein
MHGEKGTENEGMTKSKSKESSLATIPLNQSKSEYNCEACREAQTRCDRVAPVCRRCNRMGLPCKSTHVKRGRPTRESANKQKIAARQEPTKVREFAEKYISSPIFEGLTLRKNLPPGLALAVLRQRVWVGLRGSRPENIAAGITCLRTLKLPFSALADIFDNFMLPKDDFKEPDCPLRTPPSEDPSKYFCFRPLTAESYKSFQNVVPQSMIDVIDADGVYINAKFNYYGTTFFRNSKLFEDEFGAANKFNDDYHGNNYFKDLMSMFPGQGRFRITDSVLQSVFCMKSAVLSFDRRVGPVKAFVARYLLYAIPTRNKENQELLTDVEVLQAISADGAYHYLSFSFVGGMQPTPKQDHAGDTKAGMTGARRKRKRQSNSKVKLVLGTNGRAEETGLRAEEGKEGDQLGEFSGMPDSGGMPAQLLDEESLEEALKDFGYDECL